MNRHGEGVRRVENEILAEKAAALDELHAAARALADTRDENRRAEPRAAYRAARERARTARLHLLIQREAVGRRWHRVVDQQFPEPVLIRCRTGDVTMLTRELCRCGRTSARIARLKGRSDDMLVIKGVNVPSGSAWRSRWCPPGRFRAPKAKRSA